MTPIKQRPVDSNTFWQADNVFTEDLVFSAKRGVWVTSPINTKYLPVSGDKKNFAILVGSGTALNDDPQLNLRHLPPSAAPDRTGQLRLSPTRKLLWNYTNESGRAPQPWVVAYAPASLDAEWDIRRELLIFIHAVLALCVRSLMVESGAQIISAFFAAASETECMNTLLITTATLIVGAAGVGYDVPGVSADLPRAFRVWRGVW
ncbi:hypothetical protein B0H14DRAFT_3700322 [Mycena olivaceomarginata]|nr:hypothetical protein B0H14DRAFT_3700322 [Mycena olivaceomarginata]